MCSYVPTKPKSRKFYDLHQRLQEMTFEEVVNNPKQHFDNVYIKNFDLIHHQSRGDVLNYSEKFYKTISISQPKQIDYPKSYQFVATAIKSERDDVYLEKNVIKKHFKKDIELKLIEQNVFLPSMKKRAYFRKKGKCNFLRFDSQFTVHVVFSFLFYIMAY